MYKHVAIHEVGWIDRKAGRFLILDVIVNHNGAEIHEHRWKVPIHVATIAICQALLDHYDGTQFAYQGAWTLLEVVNKTAAAAQLLRVP